jgi:hypothetical protein
MKPITLILGGVIAMAGQPAVSQEQRVWFWFASCGPEALVLEVKLDGTLLYSSTIPLCRANRGADRGESPKISFSVQPRRAIEWSGYRDVDVTTTAGHSLHLDLWQAGADPDDLLIGISVSDVDSLYMNAIYIAYPKEPNSMEIAKGLVVSTHPARPGP